MPIKVPDQLPAKEILKKDNIFVMDESRAFSQDIRPLKIVILNLMPNKEATEVDLLRVLSNNPLQIEVTFIHMESHTSKNTSMDHLHAFYKVFSDISSNKYDGMIITGAPVEHLTFEDVTYWSELQTILEWTKTNVTSTFFICWAAQAGLYHFYGIDKHPLEEKLFGVYEHNVVGERVNLLKGYDDMFFAPHSRHSQVLEEDILKVKDLHIVSKSEEAGVYIVVSKDHRQIFVTGHSEYNPYTLKGEYERDLAKGLSIAIPKNYFKDDHPQNEPKVCWRAHSNILYNNWLNYYVYQETPFDWDQR